jgi:uncharacterized protein (DUF4415 family)
VRSEEYGESRYIALGILKGRVVVVAYTERDDNIRIISARKATKNEQIYYFEQLTTDWERIDAMEDNAIDLSDIPELTPEQFTKAVVKHGLKDSPNKTQLTIRVDQDVLTWFKSQGRGYQTRINSLLRAYMEANVSRSEHPRRPGR